MLATGSLADLGRRDASATPSPAAISAVTSASAKSVWSSAMTTIPAAASDGSMYTPVTALSATELLLRADTSLVRPAGHRAGPGAHRLVDPGRT
uniref:hypothetical protein n=1 Tax=Nonomuraea bangladeshensis TaxID=404385 RepID=UPI003F49AAC6